ncbi:hypothetical protein DFA_01578 [Cavenderia fasciculata]|uniref:Uncharacterized protein n=1 Tax=Cavenderia fasciculata TaxID=261658 RepID=F4PTM2_CACFS|nr:uncharacterized protein DFA_01578 [Cavenderia fasciculata]EGG21692.1 hypothetical protein DFA_01578 [Cavenderia fasciculata]|eukprot:XP_004359542.1 hypothetical protein DFA_01578 [Cavenderia fasciculata]
MNQVMHFKRRTHYVSISYSDELLKTIERILEFFEYYLSFIPLVCGLQEHHTIEYQIHVIRDYITIIPYIYNPFN